MNEVPPVPPQEPSNARELPLPGQVVKREEKLITFKESELRKLLTGIFHNDTTRLEHHQANRFGEMPPVINGRKTDRWFEPKEIAMMIAAQKLGCSDFLFEPIPNCQIVDL